MESIFGKSLHGLNEGLQNKLYRMPEDAQMKLQETLQNNKRWTRWFNLYNFIN